MDDEADLVGSAAEVACSEIFAGLGTVAGAVYVTEVAVALVSVPHVLAEHPAPETDQVTPLFCESFCTEAVKMAVVETCTEVVAGLTDTAMGRGAEVMVTLAAFDFVVSVTEVAVMVTVAGDGTLAGAV
jgi:hypothetical protein